MSGGIAYVLDPDRTFAGRVNSEMVDVEPLDDEDCRFLNEIIGTHAAETGSTVAEAVLADWEEATTNIVKVMPRDYRRVLEATRRAEAEGRSVDEAVMVAAHG
jgi:glutamate synthase (NADPH/NADH) large chain